MKTLILFASSIVANFVSGHALPSPYDSVELLPFDPRGFYRNPEQIAAMFNKHNPKIVIEIGCWTGQSTIHMASLLPKDGVLYAIDHWFGSSEHQPGQPFWSPVLPYLYQQFLSNVIHAQLTEKIIPLRMNSLDACEYLDSIRADFIYIDASHDFHSVYEDLKAWYPAVKNHGILAGDDYDCPNVSAAVHKFAKEQGLKVIVLGPSFWYYIE